MPDRNGEIRPESRVAPLLLAGLFCFALAVTIGYGSWRIFGSQARANGDTAKYLAKIGINYKNGNPAKPPQLPVKENDARAQPTPNEAQNKDANTTIEIEGAVRVPGGESIVGGGQSQRPLQREIVEGFLIGETEVTNSEYAEFVGETGYEAPSHWDKKNFPEGQDDYPVVFVSLDDAKKFCEWKSKKLGLEVRLPTRAEWELAAGGAKHFKYPWGNAWNDSTVSTEKKKRAFPVKSFVLNKSPFGAYDMVGNVWEWTGDELKVDQLVSKLAKADHKPGDRMHLVLGGSFNEDRDKLSNTFWSEIEARTRVNSVGFRYVIIPVNSGASTSGQD